MSFAFDGGRNRNMENDFWVVKIHGQEYAFMNEDDALDFYRAAKKSAGKILWSSVAHPDDPNSIAYSNRISPIEDRYWDRVDEPHVRKASWDERQQKYATEWMGIIRCDGVPRADGGNCGCYNKVWDPSYLPKSWQEYSERQEDGSYIEKHICDECQNKEVKVEYHKVVTCETK